MKSVYLVVVSQTNTHGNRDAELVGPFDTYEMAMETLRQPPSSPGVIKTLWQRVGVRIGNAAIIEG